MNTKEIFYEDRQMKYTDEVAITIPAHVTKKMIEAISAWARVFPKEQTFAQTMYGVPSIVVRFDGFLSSDGREFQSCEIQDRPSLAGFGAVVCADFKKKRDEFVREKWLPFSVIFNTKRRLHDDRLWLREISLREGLAGDMLVLIRHGLSRRNLPQRRHLYKDLISRSVTPYVHRGDKSYGVDLGWWKLVTWEGVQGEHALPWKESFVLKPTQGKRGEDVLFWVPSHRGSSSREEVLSVLEKRSSMYIQKFIEPMKMDIQGIRHSVLLRPFFGYDPKEKKWEPMHGIWVARPEPHLILGQRTDSISGPLICEL